MNKGLKYIIGIIAVIVAITGIYLISYHKKYNYKFPKIGESKYLILESNEMQGVVDRKGKVIIEPEYRRIVIPDITTDVFACYDENDKVKYLNSEKQEIFQNYEELEPVDGDRYTVNNPYRPVLKFTKNDKYGLIDLEGKEIVKPIYDEIYTATDDFNNYIVKKDGKYGLLNDYGKTVIHTEYAEIKSLNSNVWEPERGKNGYKLVKITSKGPAEGFANNKGKTLLGATYESIEKVEIPSDDYYLIVQKKGKKGLYKNNKKKMDPIYQEMAVIPENVIAKKDGKYGLYTLEGKEIIAPRFNDYKIVDKHAVFIEDNKEYAFDHNGKQIAKGIDKVVSIIPEKNYIIAENYSGERYILSGEEQIHDKYLEIIYLFDDKFVFLKDGKYGLLSIEKGVIIPEEYEYINNIYPTKILECTKGKDLILYDKDIEKIDFDIVKSPELFDDHTVILSSNTKKKYLDFDGKEKDFVSDKNIVPFNEGNKWGYKNKEGKIVVEAKYDLATEPNIFGFGSIALGNKWGSINEEGEVIEEPKYDFAESFIPQFVGKYFIVDPNDMYVRDLSQEGNEPTLIIDDIYDDNLEDEKQSQGKSEDKDKIKDIKSD